MRWLLCGENMRVQKNKTKQSVIAHITLGEIYLHHGFTQFNKISPAIKLRILRFLLIRKQKTPVCNHFRRDGMPLTPSSQIIVQILRLCAFCFHLHVLIASSKSHATIPAGHGTPLRSMLCFFPFLVHENSLLFGLRLEFFTVFPSLHQTVKAGCILHGCVHLLSLLLNSTCSCLYHKSFTQHRSFLCQLICFLTALSDEL